MTDREYELIDALYFTVSFGNFQKEFPGQEIQLADELLELIKKGWVKCLEIGQEAEREIEDPAMIKMNYRQYHFLATKKGLFAHNSR